MPRRPRNTGFSRSKCRLTLKGRFAESAFQPGFPCFPVTLLDASQGLLRWLTLPVAALLVIFNMRRFVFTLVAVTRNAGFSRRALRRVGVPAVLVLAPCRNEAATLPGLIASLARLDYPRDRLRVALIDDGSLDATRALIERAAKNHPGWLAIHIDASRGKAQALNEALAHIAFGDVIVVYDADHRPKWDSLKQLVAAFDDPEVAGASGRTVPINPTASLPAYYATVESLVHQMITMRAKDRLDLAPALLGSNCAYRRRALEQAGGFRRGALLEDSDLTLAFARLGYRLRFVPQAIAWHQAPETVKGYVRQHLRWARGFNDVARDHAGAALADRRLPPHLRVELTLFALGYLDRLALLAAIGMKALGSIITSIGDRRPRETNNRLLGSALKFAVLTPLAQVIAVFISERVPRDMWLRFPAIPLLFGLDVLVAVRAAMESIMNRPRLWMKTGRISE